MRNLFTVFGACCASVALYILLFGFAVDRPLVIDEIGTLVDQKLAYARSFSGPKIFIMGGSNARFSHSCAVLESRLHRPCVNMGVARGIGPDWLLSVFEPTMHNGDLVYLPLEYEEYGVSRAAMYARADAAYRFRHDKLSLLSRGPEGMLRAAFMFDLTTLLNSLGEMGLYAVHFHRRADVTTLDRQRDEIGHDDARAAAYESAVAAAVYSLPAPADLLANPDGEQQVLGGFLDWCHANGVTAIGGLPTTFDDVLVSDRIVQLLREFYAAHGAGFLELPNRSQYPRTDFFDTSYHLRERAQLAHSVLIADALKPLLPTAQ